MNLRPKCGPTGHAMESMGLSLLKMLRCHHLGRRSQVCTL